MRIITYITLGGLLLLTGCGMPEYEKRMDAQSTRVAEFDAANRLLDDPIDIPLLKKADDKNEPAWRFDFYLRLPKGYGKLPKDKTPYYAPFPCLRYGTEDADYSIFLAANLLPEAKGKEKIGEYQNANFRVFLRLAIAEYYEKTTKQKLNVADKIKPQDRSVTAFTAYPESAPKIKYDFISLTDQGNKQVKGPTQFDVYVHEANGKQVAIIVQHPARMQNADAFNKSIELSLSTLDLSNEAGAKRSRFRRN